MWKRGLGVRPGGENPRGQRDRVAFAGDLNVCPTVPQQISWQCVSTANLSYMTHQPSLRRAAGVCGLFGLVFVITALGRVPQKEIYREDAQATVLESRAPETDVSFAPPAARVERGTEGDSIVLARSDGAPVSVRGPVTYAGAAASASLDTPDGPLTLVVWDEYEGEVEHGGSFDVLASFVLDGVVEPAFVLAGGPAFQARPSVAWTTDAKNQSSAWVTWEEGPDAWGAPYRSVDQQWNNATDSLGPLHTWRATRLARVERDGAMREYEVPMPSFKLQRLQPERRPGAERVGVFYERPVIFGDGGEHAWVAYRHVHQREAGLQIPKLTTHVERGFSVYVRQVAAGGLGPLYRIDERQRDGEQRMQFRRTGSGTELVLEIGRSDRRADKQSKGLRIAHLPPAEPITQSTTGGAWQEPIPAPAASVRQRNRASVEVNGSPYSLFFGDLHRHTDLSLCFPFFDGSLDDAYRYALGPAALDFVAVTDHARDLDQGNVESRPWQLHVAAADRFDLPGRFVAFRAYERSQGNCDHNVLGLTANADFLRSHRPPLTEFWDEFPADEVFTIPHATAARPGQRFCGDVWTKRDDVKRPIAEVYQAFRDVSSMEELQQRALLTGQKLGFIASSDHLATSSAYACVWNPGPSHQAGARESLFRSLQARRCYGATSKIELSVTATPLLDGERAYWMGEDLPDAPAYTVRVKGRGTAEIERLEYWSGGEIIHTVETGASADYEGEFSWKPPVQGQQYLFVRVVQEDGEEAWSSPFFVRWSDA